MTILLVTFFYYPNEVGGAEAQTRSLAKFLAANGFEVTVLAFDSTSGNSVEVIENYKVIRIDAKVPVDLYKDAFARISLSKFDLLRYKIVNKHRAIDNALSELKNNFQEKPDIIQFCGNFVLLNFGNLIKLIKKHFYCSNYIVALHDHMLLGRKSVYPNGKWPVLSDLAENLISEEFDFIICPSHYLSELVKNDCKLTDNKVKTLYNFIPNISFGNKGTGINGAINILYAGSIELNKGLDILSESFIELFQLYPNINLIIIGDGNYKKKMKELLSGVPSDAYIFYNKQSREQTLSFMKKTNFVILPSRFNETFGLSLIEGYFNGAIPLCSNRGAMPEVIGFDSDLIFENASDLVNKIKFFLDNPEKIAQKYFALAKVMEQYKEENIKKTYLDFYSSLIVKN